jgi:hypothetical protein
MSGRTSASSVESLSPQSLRADCWNIGFPGLRRNCTPGPRDWNCSQEWSIEPGAKRRLRGLAPSGVGLIEPKVTNIPVGQNSRANLLLVIIEIRLIFLMAAARHFNPPCLELSADNKAGISSATLDVDR